jgi:hypothetical protein
MPLPMHNRAEICTIPTTWMGLCPLHDDHPAQLPGGSRQELSLFVRAVPAAATSSALLNSNHQVRFPKALALLYQWRPLGEFRGRRLEKTVVEVVVVEGADQVTNRLVLLAEPLRVGVGDVTLFNIKDPEPWFPSIYPFREGPYTKCC